MNVTIQTLAIALGVSTIFAIDVRAEQLHTPAPSLYGFQIGTNLNFPSCHLEINSVLVKKTCRQGPTHSGFGADDWLVVFPFSNAPQLVRDQTMLVSTISGKIESVAFGTDGLRVQQSVYAQLLEKFGAPTTTRVEEAQNAFGARFEIRQAFWDFGSFTVKFYGSDGRIDHGGVEMKSAKYAAKEHAWKQRQQTTEPKM